VLTGIRRWFCMAAWYAAALGVIVQTVAWAGLSDPPSGWRYEERLPAWTGGRTNRLAVLRNQSASSGYWVFSGDRVDVGLFGAGADDLQSDEEALQTAIDLACRSGIRRVTFPRGVFLIGSRGKRYPGVGIKLGREHDGLSLEGIPGGTVLRVAGGRTKNYQAASTLLSADGSCSFTVRGLTFDGNLREVDPYDAEQNLIGAQPGGRSDGVRVSISECIFTNICGKGIVTRDGRWSISHCVFTGSVRDANGAAIYVSGQQGDILIQSNRFSGIGSPRWLLSLRAVPQEGDRLVVGQVVRTWRRAPQPSSGDMALAETPRSCAEALERVLQHDPLAQLFGCFRQDTNVSFGLFADEGVRLQTTGNWAAVRRLSGPQAIYAAFWNRLQVLDNEFVRVGRAVDLRSSGGLVSRNVVSWVGADPGLSEDRYSSVFSVGKDGYHRQAPGLNVITENQVWDPPQSNVVLLWDTYGNILESNRVERSSHEPTVAGVREPVAPPQSFAYLKQAWGNIIRNNLYVGSGRTAEGNPAPANALLRLRDSQSVSNVLGMNVLRDCSVLGIFECPPGAGQAPALVVSGKLQLKGVGLSRDLTNLWRAQYQGVTTSAVDRVQMDVGGALEFE